MRTFTNAANYLEVNTTFTTSSVGCIVLYYRPNYTVYNNNAVPYSLLEFRNTATNDLLTFYKLPPSNDGGPLPWPEHLWVGCAPGTPPAANVDWRVLVNSKLDFESAPLLRTDDPAWWQYTWDAPNGCSWLFKNGLCIGGLLGRPGYHIPFTPHTYDRLRIGGDGGYTANGDIGEFAIFNYHLDDTQRENMMLTGIAGVSPGPTHWWKILGTTSPEPAEVGGSPLTVIGSPPQASFAHPTFRSVPPQIVAADKPAIGTPINPAHPLATDLIWALPFNEGSGMPKENVSGVTGTLDPDSASAPAPGGGGLGSLFWEADGSLHFTDNDAIRWEDVTVFDGLESMTICMYLTMDLYTWNSGSDFAFPNNGNPMLFGKQFSSGYSTGAQSQSVFMISLNHDDETEGSNGGHLGSPFPHLGHGSGGRWGFWTLSGQGEGPVSGGGFPSMQGIDTWTSWRTTWMPWTTRYRQIFLIYDVNAPAGERWIMRVNGRREFPGDLSIDSPLPLPTTDAPVVLGAMQVSPFGVAGGYHGKFQYIYAWAGIKPDVWQELLDSPYAMYEGSAPPNFDITAAPGAYTLDGHSAVFTLGGAPIEPEFSTEQLYATDRKALLTTLEAWNMMTKQGLTDQQVANCERVEDLYALFSTLFRHSEHYRLSFRTREMLRRGEVLGILTDEMIDGASTVAEVHAALVALRGENDRDIFSAQYQGT